MVSMQARRHALQEADALLRELAVAQDLPIDVFALIGQLDSYSFSMTSKRSSERSFRTAMAA